MFRAQPTIDPVDMRQNVSYFSAKPNARSVQALLDGDENGFRLADPLADGERLRAIFRTIDDVSAQDGRMTLSIEAIGDNTTERTTLVTLEKVEGAMLDVNLSERPAPVYRVVGISFVDCGADLPRVPAGGVPYPSRMDRAQRNPSPASVGNRWVSLRSTHPTLALPILRPGRATYGCLRQARRSGVLRRTTHPAGRSSTQAHPPP